MGDRGNQANPMVAFRDLMRGEARKISQANDQVILGVICAIKDGIDIEVQIDGFGSGPIDALWCVPGSQPTLGMRVVMNALTGGQKWFVVAVAAAGVGAGGKKVRYVSTDTFVKADFPGLRAINVRLVGGGGAGGGRRNSPNGGRGGGGAGGGYAEKYILASDMASSETITIGSRGIGAYNLNGIAGGASSFGSHVIGNGGGGGARSAGSGVTVSGGSGGNTTDADFSVNGQEGQDGRFDVDYGSVSEASGGHGGSSHLGFGTFGQPLGASGGGFSGQLYGGGGGGALGQNATTGGGGHGAKGIVIVELIF